MESPEHTPECQKSSKSCRKRFETSSVSRDAHESGMVTSERERESEIDNIWAAWAVDREFVNILGVSGEASSIF